MTTVLHLHIPRTGGTSVSRALRSALRDRRTVLTASGQDLREALNDGAEIGLVSGHFRWGMHNGLPTDYVYFVVLRDPVERVKSLYDYIRSQPTHRLHDLYATTALEGLLARPDVRLALSNGQVRQIAGVRTIPETMGDAILEQAWENLCSAEAIVAFTDRIAEGLAILGRRLNRSIPALKRAMNRSTSHTPVSPELDEQLRVLNRLDLELYRRALERFGSVSSESDTLLRRALPVDLMDRVRRLIRVR